MKLRGYTWGLKVWPLFLLFSLFFAPRAFASQYQDYISKATQLKLADDPFWQNLLHFNGKHSEILDDDFFLSSQGSNDPQKELESTIEAYFTRKHSIKKEHGDTDIVCIFPARYSWLNTKLSLPDFKIDQQSCPSLFDWARVDQIEAVNILYVSGYLGNPASSFGHILLKLKLRGQEELQDLFDTAITYGATVPANENMIAYVFKGLLGGYNASFTDKYFYTHDQVYSNREARDMWEYTLNLSDSEIKLLIYHLAELLTKRYQYYFLSANCAHRIAVLLDIFIDEEVYNFKYPVYVPEELFHRLQMIDEKRVVDGKPALIKNIRYIPSARRSLFYQTKDLTDKEREIFRTIIHHPKEDFSLEINKVDVSSRIHILNALLAYQYYKLMQSPEGAEDPDLKKFKDKILVERLHLPPQKQEPIVIPDLPSPKEVSPPSSFNFGFVIQQGNKPFPTIGVTVFRKESVGLNALEFNDLTGLSLNVGFADGSHEAFVDTFDFLKITDFKTLPIKEADENPFSWRLRAGMDRHRKDDHDEYDYLFDTGAGLVQKIKNYGVYYGFINGSVHSIDEHFRSGPSAGFIVGNNKIKLQGDFGLDYNLKNFEFRENLMLNLQYQLNRSNALKVTFENNTRERLFVNYILFW